VKARNASAAAVPESAHLSVSVGFELVDEFDSNSWGGPVREQRYELQP
jgi:hypothetical protein